MVGIVKQSARFVDVTVIETAVLTYASLGGRKRTLPHIKELRKQMTDL